MLRSYFNNPSPYKSPAKGSLLLTNEQRGGVTVPGHTPSSTSSPPLGCGGRSSQVLCLLGTPPAQAAWVTVGRGMTRSQGHSSSRREERNHVRAGHHQEPLLDSEGNPHREGTPGGAHCVLPRHLCRRGPRCCMGERAPQQDGRTDGRTDQSKAHSSMGPDGTQDSLGSPNQRHDPCPDTLDHRAKQTGVRGDHRAGVGLPGEPLPSGTTASLPSPGVMSPAFSRSGAHTWISNCFWKLPSSLRQITKTKTST